MRPPDNILAKSQPPLSLPQHTCDVLTIRELLQPQFPQVAAVAGAWFWDDLWWALLLHDMGKAHQQFQQVLAGQDVPEWPGQRHELFSLPLVAALVADPARILSGGGAALWKKTLPTWPSGPRASPT